MAKLRSNENFPIPVVEELRRLGHDVPEHDGIIVCTVDADAIGLAARIHAAIEAGGELGDQLIRVNRSPR